MKMTKNWQIASIVVLFVVVVGGSYWYAKDQNKTVAPPPVAKTVAADAPAGVAACNLFTLSEAKGLIGTTAVPLEGDNLLGNHYTATSSITTCPYTLPQGDPAVAANYQTASLEVTYAKNATGASNNQANYNEMKTASKGVSTVTGLGDQAFYVPSSGEISVLKGSYWLIGSTTTVTPSGPLHNQSQSEKIVQEALAKL